MDLQILHALANARTPFFNAFFIFVTKLGDGGIFWIAFCLALLFLLPAVTVRKAARSGDASAVAAAAVRARSYRMAGLMMALSLILGAVIGNLILKPIFNRTRPFLADPTLTILIKAPTSVSFPSGHTTSSFASAVSFCLDPSQKRGLKILAIVAACLIAFSRLYVGVHYPTDVLGGIIIGVVSACLIRALMKHPKMQAAAAKLPGFHA